MPKRRYAHGLSWGWLQQNWRIPAGPLRAQGFSCPASSCLPFPPPKVRATHPDCSIVLYFHEQEAECLEMIRRESQTAAPPGQRGESEPPALHGPSPSGGGGGGFAKGLCGGWSVAGGLQSAHGCECLQENGDSAEAKVTEHPWRAPRNAAAGRDRAGGVRGG